MAQLMLYTKLPRFHSTIHTHGVTYTLCADRLIIFSIGVRAGRCSATYDLHYPNHDSNSPTAHITAE